MTPSGPKFGRTYYYVFFALAFCATIAAFVLLILNREYIDQLQQSQSYYGLFIVAFLASAPLPVFFPIAFIVFALGSLMNPLLIGIASGLGNAIGNTLTYTAGHAGNRMMASFYSTFTTDAPTTRRIERILRKVTGSKLYGIAYERRLLGLFIVSCLPTPFIMPMVFSMGVSRVTPWKVILIACIGQTLQAIVLAFLGQIGLRAILDVFGVF